MNENSEESILSTNPNFPGYAKRQDEREWLVFRNDGAQVGLINATDTPGIFDVASVPRWANARSTLFEVDGFQEALAHCLKHFRPSPW
ncbi:hypothetical protein ACVWY0_003582 [Arthrobacter sp. UYNi723]